MVEDHMSKKKISKIHPCRTSPWTHFFASRISLRRIALDRHMPSTNTCATQWLVPRSHAWCCMKLPTCKIQIFQWFSTSSYSGLFHPASLPSCHDSSVLIFSTMGSQTGSWTLFFLKVRQLIFVTLTSQLLLVLWMSSAFQSKVFML